MSGTVYQDFEQKVKLLGDWLVFLKVKEQEYQTQLERARRAGAAAEPQAESEEEQGTAEPSFFGSVRQQAEGAAPEGAEEAQPGMAETLRDSPSFNNLRRAQMNGEEEKADSWI